METDLVVQSLGTGGAVAIAFQLFKSGWNRWLTVIAALVGGFGAGYAQGGLEQGLVAAAATLGTHSALFAGTNMGGALKLQLTARILNVVSELAAALAKSISNKPNGTPPA